MLAPPSKPATYGDLADDAAAKCIQQKGYGEWRGSMGISLEKFCRAAGGLAALQAYRREHPEKF